MPTPDLWLVVVCLAVPAIALAWAAARRVRRAQSGERRLLLRRRRILRVYHRRRDGRVYDSERNPDVARVLGRGPRRAAPTNARSTVTADATRRADRGRISHRDTDGDERTD